MDFDDALVEDDIREEENAIRDIRDFSGFEKTSKTASALNHCDYFLKGCCAKEKLKFHRLVEMPCHAMDGKGNVFWDKMISSFMHYLGSAKV